VAKTIQKKERKKGFSILELLITIFVVSVGIVGVFGLTQNTLSAALATRSRVVAAYLAQEGIELTKNIRDNNWIDGKEWKEGMLQCSESLGNGCKISYDSSELSTGITGNLRVNGNGFYGYSGEESKFKRVIFIEENISEEYVEVKVNVSWEEKGKPYDITAVEHLYNWK